MMILHCAARPTPLYAISTVAKNVRHQKFNDFILSKGLATAAVAQAIDRVGLRQPVNELTAAAVWQGITEKSGRLERLKDAKPFSAFLTDSFTRQHTYLRISLTERCNLRCTYCMPEEGVPLAPNPTQLTTPEILLLSSLFVSQGVNKIRLTGGEPTVRKDIVSLMQSLGSLRSQGLKELCITSNGVALKSKLDSMVEAGLTGLNLSLDTLNSGLFQIMTRRKGFEKVIATLDRVLEMNKLGARIKLKVNVVVMRGINEQEVLKFVELGREKDLEVRFIEYMPFGGNKWQRGKMVSYEEMLNIIKAAYPDLQKVRDARSETSKTYHVPGFAGRVGFITSMTDNFCGSCNRLRITSDGNLKVCLFGNAEVSLRDLLRKENGGQPIDDKAYECMKQYESDNKTTGLNNSGWQGSAEREQELLEVIGKAVGRKKERHAGMGVLENMKNRPMILIDENHSFNGRSSPITRFKYGNISPGIIYELLASRITTSSLYLQTKQYHSNATKLLLKAPSRSGKKARNPCYEHQPLISKRCVSNSKLTETKDHSTNSPQGFTHLNSASEVHMVSIANKMSTRRLATAVCQVEFSEETMVNRILSLDIQKGDVIGLARTAGIMAVKKTSEIIPLCHPGLAIEGVDMVVKTAGGRLQEGVGKYGGIVIECTVACEGKTGVEMEALTGAIGAALTVYDMCKAVDKKMIIGSAKVVKKEGGRSGNWVDQEWLDKKK